MIVSVLLIWFIWLLLRCVRCSLSWRVILFVFMFSFCCSMLRWILLRLCCNSSVIFLFWFSVVCVVVLVCILRLVRWKCCCLRLSVVSR